MTENAIPDLLIIVQEVMNILPAEHRVPTSAVLVVAMLVHHYPEWTGSACSKLVRDSEHFDNAGRGIEGLRELLEASINVLMDFDRREADSG